MCMYVCAGMSVCVYVGNVSVFIYVCMHHSKQKTKQLFDDQSYRQKHQLQYPCLFVVVLCHSNSISVYHGGDMMYEMRRRKP